MDGVIINRSTPVLVNNTLSWSKTACSEVNSFAITSTGTLFGWGYNNVGSVGDGTTTFRSTPVQIGSGSWSQISCGSNFAVGVKTDGTIWSWGRNYEGQLGLNNTTLYSSPVQIGTGNNWSNVSCGIDYTLAIKTDGTIWSWGTNYSGQLGDGTLIDKSSPVQIGSNSNWTKVCTEYWDTTSTVGSFALDTSGSVYAWGITDYTVNQKTPYLVKSDIIDFSANSRHAMYLKST